MKRRTCQSNSKGRSITWPTAFVLVLGGASVVGLIMLFDFVRNNPMADFVQGDAGVYWNEAGRIAQGRIVDTRPFQSIPLYSLFLGAIRFLGGGLVTVYVVQTAMHVATAGMIARIAVDKFDQMVGIATCVLFVLMEEPAFYVTRLLPGTLQLFLVAALMLAAQRARLWSRLRASLMIGLLTGLFALSYPPALLMIPLLPLCMKGVGAIQQRWGSENLAATTSERHGVAEISLRSAGRLTPRMAGLLSMVTACITIMPVTVLNWMACNEFIPITAHAGITFLQGNAPGADGVYTPIKGISAVREKMHSDAARLFANECGHTGGYSEIDRFFFRRGVEYLISNPARAAWLLIRKAYWFFTGRHYSDIYFPTLELADGWLPALRFAPIATAWLMGPALMGLWIMRRLNALSLIDSMMIAIPLLVVVLFWFTPRYRLPTVPLIAIASAVFLVRFARMIERKQPFNLLSTGRRYASVGISLLCAIASFLVPAVNRASGFDDPDAYRPQYEYNWGQHFLGRRDFEAALSHFALSNELDPDRPHVLVALATTLVQLDRGRDAEATLRRLEMVDPDSASTWLAVGGMYLRYQRWSEAKSAFDKATKIEPLSSEAHLGMWVSFNGLGIGKEEIEHLIRAVHLDGSNALAACEYGLWLAQNGPPTQAQRQLRHCLAIAPDAWNRPEIRRAINSVIHHND